MIRRYIIASCSIIGAILLVIGVFYDIQSRFTRNEIYVNTPVTFVEKEIVVKTHDKVYAISGDKVEDIGEKIDYFGMVFYAVVSLIFATAFGFIGIGTLFIGVDKDEK